MFRLYLGLLIMSSLSGCLPAAFTAATTTALSVAKDRSIGNAVDDAKISAAIKAAFIKNNFRELYTKISVEVLQGRVLYTGTVDKEEDMLEAVRIAWDQEGVTEVINELKVDKDSGHFNLLQYTRDTLITSQIKARLFAYRNIKFVNYTVITVDNVVYLFGIARSNEELELVADIASKIRGVEKVVSHARIQVPFAKKRHHEE